MKKINQTSRLLTLVGLINFDFSAGDETLMSLPRLRNLQWKQEECTGLVFGVQNEDRSHSSGLACEYKDGQIRHIEGLSDEIIAGFKNGTYTSGETIIDMPDASLNMTTGIINPGSKTKVRKQKVNSGEKRVIGDRSFLVVRVIATNSETTASQEQLGDSVFGTLGDSVNLKSQYAACSHGRYNVTTSPDRNSVDTRPGITDGATTVTVAVSTSQGDGVMRPAITTELNSQFGVGSPSYLANHVLYCLPPYTMSGIAYAYYNSWSSVYSDRWCQYLSAQMHEIGHNINLGHSWHYGVEYADQTGMMGYSYSNYDGPLMCFNAAKMSQLEWVQNKEVVVTVNVGSYVGELAGYIEDYEDDDVPPMVVKLDSSGNTEDYYVFFNRAAGFNSGTVEGQNQVCVTSKTGSGNNKSDLVAKLSAGQSFETTGGGLIQVYSIGARASVYIGFPDAGKPTSNPSGVPSSSPTRTSLPTISPTGCSGVPLVIDLTTDLYPDESNWTVKGSNGIIIAQNPELESQTTYSSYLCLPAEDECYTFEITDSFGDGICCFFGDGLCTVTFDGDLIFRTTWGFDSESVDFCVSSTEPPNVVPNECLDSTAVITGGANTKCPFVAFNLEYCDSNGVPSHCPLVCDACALFECADSTLSWNYGPDSYTCGQLASLSGPDIEFYCEVKTIYTTCRATCGICNM